MNKTSTTIVALQLLWMGTSLVQAASASPQHSIDVELNPATGSIRIDDRLILEGTGEYRFRLAPWLDIESLAVDGIPHEAEPRGYEWVVPLGDADRHQLDFMLRGVVPSRSGDSQSDAAMLSSSGDDGVYLPGYDSWIPGDGSGAIRYRLQVRVPAAQRAVATGKLVSETVDDDLYRAVFEVSQASEAPSLFIGPYQVRERYQNGLRLRTYFHAELTALSDTYLDAAAAYIERFQSAVGSYPYDDFHVISAPLPVGLGFPNLTYVGRRVIPLPFMRGRSLAHEVLHNWWGNGIAVDYANGNWAEGLTTFMADYALERDKGEAEARSMRLKWLRDYAALPADRDQPVRDFRSKRHQAAQVIGYNKVAFIFHMLMQEIGRSAFDQGLRLFWNRHKHARAGWRDLQSAFEQTAGRELDWFFRQWLDRRGAPRLSIGSHGVEQTDDGFRISVEIVQPVSGYQFRLPVLLRTANGSERHEIIISETLTRVEWSTSSKPQSLHFDPDSDLFRLLQKNETPPILRDVTLSSDTVTMIGSADAEFNDLARNLASRLVDVTPRLEPLALGRDLNRPLLLLTTSDNLPGQLEQLGINRPQVLATGGYSAAAWTARLANGNPVLIVSADDEAALQTLSRPLPHYGGQSYVLFDAGRAGRRGIWPVTRGPLFLDLGGN